MSDHPSPSKTSSRYQHLRLVDVLVAVGVAAICGGLAMVARPFITESDKVMIFLLGVVIVAYRAPLRTSVLTALAGVATFNFFFVPPVYTFVVDETGYWLTFFTMGSVGLVVSSLAWRVRGQALERASLEAENYATELSLEKERLRNSLLSSISHDLRTPVASIVGSVELLRDSERALDQKRQDLLLDSVWIEANRLQLLLVNLLEMTRIEGGGLELHPDWYPVDEIVGGALSRLDGLLNSRSIYTEVDGGLVFLDETSITTALANLVENAVKYSPASAPIEI
ncbi:MAG: DUF4118 domain-containing protein, partial [Bradymonadaceae bacterium]